MVSLGLSCEERSYSHEWNRREFPSLVQDGKVTRCKSENRVPIVVVSNEAVFPMTVGRRRATGCKFQVPDRQETGREKLFNPMSQARRVQAPGGRSHEVPERLQLFTQGLSVERPDSHKVVEEPPVVEPKEKTPGCELLRRVNRSSIYRRNVKETKHKQSNWQAQCFYKISKDPNCKVCMLTKTT